MIIETEDGKQYCQGKKYWFVVTDAILAITMNKIAYQPYNDWHFRIYKNNQKVFAFEKISNAFDFVSSVIKKSEVLFDKEVVNQREILKSIIDTYSSDLCTDLILVLDELKNCQIKHPVYPENIYERLSIVSEEAGELAQAVNNVGENKCSFKEVQVEAIQTASSAIRFLNNLHEMKIV